MMGTFYNAVDLQFFTPRHSRKLTKYAILLNETTSDSAEEEREEPCSLAAELLPHLQQQKENEDDLVTVFGEILKGKIISHAEVDNVPILKPDEIIANNDPMLVPVMYRIAADNFAQTKSLFKIIECRNVTKLNSDWKPSLPDKLIALGHQVIVVQLETSFVPYSDFAYAVLRQLDCDWKNRLPRSFFFPDDVCKVEATYDRDLCVVSPSMPDGDLEINKKMGQLNYELLMMIKTSCMSAMKNYLMKRDLRVGKFSDTLDGVAALRHLYRKLQEKLRTGEDVELTASYDEDLRRFVKQSVGGGADVLAAQTWIEYGKRIGLDIPASASSSATSISSARSIIEKGTSNGSNDDENEDKFQSDDDGGGEGDDDGDSGRKDGDGIRRKEEEEEEYAPSSGIDKDDGKDCQIDEYKGEEEKGSNKTGESLLDSPPAPSTRPETVLLKMRPEVEEKDDDDDEEEDLFMETLNEFKDSLDRMDKTKRKITDEAGDDEDEDLFLQKFSAESILKILELPKEQELLLLGQM